MKDRKSILECLEKSPAIFSGLIRSIPSRFIARRRGEGVWTIEEHAVHLARVQPMLLERLNRFVEEERPEFVPYIPENEDSGNEAERNDEADKNFLLLLRLDSVRNIDSDSDQIAYAVLDESVSCENVWDYFAVDG